MIPDRTTDAAWGDVLAENALDDNGAMALASVVGALSRLTLLDVCSTHALSFGSRGQTNPEGGGRVPADESSPYG